MGIIDIKIKMLEFIKRNWFWIIYFGISFIFIIILAIAKYKCGIEFNTPRFWIKN